VEKMGALGQAWFAAMQGPQDGRNLKQVPPFMQHGNKLSWLPAPLAL
jgi:hypothetical protein